MRQRPRLLHRRSEFGYTDRLVQALPAEPEAVPADYQRRLSALAPQRAQARDRDVWAPSHDLMREELIRLRSHRFARDVSAELRALERQIERLDQLICA